MAAANGSLLNKLGDRVTHAAGNFWVAMQEVKSPQSKAGRVESPPPDHVPFTKQQVSFLERAMTSVSIASTNAFGHACQEKFDEVDRNILENKNETAKLREDFDEHIKEYREYRKQSAKQVEQAKKELQEHRSQRPDSASASASRETPARSTVRHLSRDDFPPSSLPPMEMRSKGKLLNLGWNLDETELVSRAKDVLTEAGISPEQYKEPWADFSPGSAVWVPFETPIEFRNARTKIRNLQKTFPNARDTCFMVMEKTEFERAPGKVLAKLKMVINDFEQRKGENKTVTGGGPIQEIKVDGRVVVWMAGVNPRWTQHAIDRYPESAGFEPLNEVSQWALSGL